MKKLSFILLFSLFLAGCTQEESNITAPGGALPQVEGAETKVSYEKEITRWIVLALLLLIIVEWGLQYREQF